MMGACGLRTVKRSRQLARPVPSCCWCSTNGIPPRGGMRKEATMHAAVLTCQGTPEQLEHDTQVGQRLLPIMREQAGFQGYYRLRDREGGKALIITLWE